MDDCERVLEAYGTLVYRVCRVKLAEFDPSLADDAYQNTFLCWIERKPTVEAGSEHERAWFIKATMNRCYDLIRKNQIRVAIPLEEALGVAAQDHTGVTELMEMLMQIPEIYKDTVILHCLEGYSLEETAKLLDISLSAAKMRLSRAREALKAMSEEGKDV